MDYMSTKEAAQKWGISERRVRSLCATGKIEEPLGVVIGFGVYQKELKNLLTDVLCVI